MTEARDIEATIERVLHGCRVYNLDGREDDVAGIFADWRAKKAEIERLRQSLADHLEDRDRRAMLMVTSSAPDDERNDHPPG